MNNQKQQPLPTGDGDENQSAPTLGDQIKCVQREVSLRERVYPRLVEQNRMKQHVADYELRTMRAVAETVQRYKRIAALITEDTMPLAQDKVAAIEAVLSGQDEARGINALAMRPAKSCRVGEYTTLEYLRAAGAVSVTQPDFEGFILYADQIERRFVATKEDQSQYRRVK